MSSKVGRRLAVAIVGALAAIVGLAAPALAAPVPQIPPDVEAVFAGAALRQAQAAADGVSADFTGARADHIHEVFSFSGDFIDGIPTTEPVVSSGQWLAAIMRGDEVLGTVGVVKPPGAPAEPNGFADDVVVGTALGTLADTELLIADEPNGAYYALAGRTVRPLNDWAGKVLPEPKDISDVQKIVAGQYTLLRDQPADPVGAPVLPISLAVMALVLAAIAITLVLLRRRDRYGRLAP